MPRNLPGWPLGWSAAGLLVYWLLRLWVSFGLGMRGVAAFPAG
ncbi:hypothetical protein [Synechococcus sp. GFB01]